ncbi:uncharacterized protein [Montipora foliosa]|uniref:uncharacterized protein n=2 Tax=Montipora TaxID=46703 RepID=UPI0035F1F4DF
MKPSAAIVFLSLMVQTGWAAQCNVNVGPPGITACVNIPGYIRKQWATCLTNTYIQQKSGHKHRCTLTYVKYCWYQCMVEVHSQNYGSVTRDCSCNETSNQRPSPSLILPSFCYSPSGNSCAWYHDCLEKKYSCEDLTNAYAIRYAEKFCSLYNETSPLLSQKGRQWMDSVRKCLLVSLVTLLRPWVSNLTCQEMRRNAFDTHVPCYLNPDRNTSSICDLDCSDFIKIFLTIKGSFPKLDTAWESMKGMWNIENRCSKFSRISKCLRKGKGSLINHGIKIYRITITRVNQSAVEPKGQTVPLSDAEERSRFADSLGAAIARSLKWNADVMDWLAYPDENSVTNIFIVLADKKSLALTNDSATSIDFNHIAAQFSTAIEEGKLPSEMDGYHVRVRILSSCSDKSCSDSQTLAESTVVQTGWAAQCNVNVGPPGITGCIKLPGYFRKQWATCLTNTYIQQKSGHKHRCTLTYVKYCWYQCMVEVHRQNYGSVTRDCSCNEPSNQRPSPSLILPSFCYSPSGNSCAWYHDCLEKKYSCEDLTNAYAIRYAEKFCSLYNETSSLLSQKGRQWMDSVRKCLLVSLVPLLRPWVSNLTCQEMRRNAFDTHVPCYLNPDRNTLSICDLDCSDFIKIFLTIKGSFPKLDTAWESMKGMWNIENRCSKFSRIFKCLRKGKGSLINHGIKIYRITITRVNQSAVEPKGQTVPLSDAEERSRFADSLGAAIARSLKWNADVMDWLAYPDENSVTNIFIVLADKKSLALTNDSATSIDFNHIAAQFSTAIEEGKLPSEMDGYHVRVRILSSCSDKSCSDSQTLAESSKVPKWYQIKNDRNVAASTTPNTGFIVVLAMFLNKCF